MNSRKMADELKNISIKFQMNSKLIRDKFKFRKDLQ